MADKNPEEGRRKTSSKEYRRVSISSRALALLVVCWLSTGSAGCVGPRTEILILTCPTPNPEAIESLMQDDIPRPIIDYLIDIDMYCDAVDAIAE